MALGHEKLDVYRLSIGYVAWVYEMAATLSRLGGRGYQIREDQAAYSVDFDPDSDFDPEERKSQRTDALDAHSSRQ
ncbi:MAG: hypothetical protein SWH68_05785 [Thermodesulfobacteriota bacterium]|nr:hypothetical protein [Thermodesulfobacteriota bacterium]